jgi:glycosyltransferase involved in cell wall biosynthesis
MSNAREVVPKVSVIMPAYNADRYIAQAIESILGQSFRDFELLVLDDGSTDGSLNMAKAYESKDSRVRVLARQHRGVVKSMRELINNARGDYIAFMDADDVSLPDRIEKEVAFLDAHPGCVAVSGWLELVNARGQPIRVIDYPLDHAEIDRRNLAGCMAFVHGAAMIRREAVASVPASEHAYASDLDFWLRVGEAGRLANIPHVLLQYRLHAGSISEAHLDEQFASMQAICQTAWDRRGTVGGEFKGEKNWRYATDVPTRHKILTDFGWMAWRNGHRETWWSYAWEALRLRPFALSSWKLLIFGFLRSQKHA